MIARAFAPVYSDNQDVVIFASGVSNSSETRQEAFEREKALLSHWARGGHRLVYFSTCSVADPSQIRKPYVRHKLEMESIVEGTGSYVIFRLPQIVG